MPLPGMVDPPPERRGPGCWLGVAALTLLIWVCTEGVGLLWDVVVPSLFTE